MNDVVDDSYTTWYQVEHVLSIDLDVAHYIAYYIAKLRPQCPRLFQSQHRVFLLVLSRSRGVGLGRKPSGDSPSSIQRRTQLDTQPRRTKALRIFSLLHGCTPIHMWTRFWRQVSHR